MTRHPRRILLTLLHLVVLGAVGTGIVGLLFGMLTAGIASLLAFGIGLVILVPLVYVLFGVAWFEIERVAGLYALAVPRLRLRPAPAPGFIGFVKALAAQAVDGRMWRALANFTIGTVFGLVILGLTQMVFAIAMPTSGWARRFPTRLDPADTAFWLILTVAVVIALAAMAGLAALYRSISIAIIESGIREAELEKRVQVTTEQRAGAVRAADVERTRIERDLHDGIQPRLVSVGMTLGLALQKIDREPEDAKALVAEAHTSTKAAITELRQLARGIHASVLDDRGLDAALSALAARSHIPVKLDIRTDKRCSRQAETAVYFAIAEALTNAAKHSHASECRVAVRQRDDATLWARIDDDGVGGAHTVAGGGIDGIVNRITATGGTVQLNSPKGGPTSLEVNVPCGS